MCDCVHYFRFSVIIDGHYFPKLVRPVLRRITFGHTQDSQSMGRDSNPGPHEYEAGVFNHSTTVFSLSLLKM
jgi:hypothetical protein